MVTTLENYNALIYQTSYLDQYNGVVLVTNGKNSGTGSLLYDGRSILTAAHLFDSDESSRATAYFQTSSGELRGIEGALHIHENYDSININADLAIITLSEAPSELYSRYELYRESDELFQDFTMVGYGDLGYGSVGVIDSNDTNTKLITQNRFEVDMYDIYTSDLTSLTWRPLPQSKLAADFDSGDPVNDLFNYLFGYADTGVGNSEGIIASGDSGGPAFIENMLAGTASYTTRLNQAQGVDINTTLDSSFGELAAWQRVSYYQEWIDKTIRSNLPDAPKSKAAVEKSVLELDNDTTYAYFLLEHTQDRLLIEENITLSYTTKDGTATAGEDYIAVAGVVTLYRDESQVVIPVEIIGDNKAEEDETFYLEVSNPSHGSLGEDRVTLIAVRTILDDDGYIL